LGAGRSPAKKLSKKITGWLRHPVIFLQEFDFPQNSVTFAQTTSRAIALNLFSEESPDSKEQRTT